MNEGERQFNKIFSVPEVEKPRIFPEMQKESNLQIERPHWFRGN